VHYEVYTLVHRNFEDTFKIRKEVVAPTSAGDAGPLW
jgi:hypothetical protein